MQVYYKMGQEVKELIALSDLSQGECYWWRASLCMVSLAVSLRKWTLAV